MDAIEHALPKVNGVKSPDENFACWLELCVPSCTAMEKPILIVDDSDDDARLLALELKRAGVLNPIVTVNSGFEAIYHLGGAKAFAKEAEHPIPSVMFLDLKMPRVDGYDVLDWVRKQPQLESILVVVLSGAREVFDINKAYRFGANSFLTKPFTEGDLINLQKGFPGPWKIASSSNSHENKY